MKYVAHGLATLALLAGTFAMQEAAHAHATFENREVVQNSTVRMVTRIPHGCAGEPTLRVRIAIPDGVVSVKPMPKAGWELTTVTGPLSQPFTSHGREITEGVQEIIWEGELLDEHYDEFIFRAQFTDQLPANEMLFIPVVQECESASERWIEIPTGDQTRSDLRYPAPGVMVLPADGHGHSHGHSHGDQDDEANGHSHD